MKIDDLLSGLQGVTNKNSVGKSAASGGVDFQQLLQEQLLRQDDPVSAAGPTASVAISAPVSPALRLEGLSLSESAIDTLESFGAALENQNFSAADLGSYVDAMEEGAVGLMSVKDQLPADDLLGQLLERVATVSYLEAAKYRRGDYSA